MMKRRFGGLVVMLLCIWGTVHLEAQCIENTAFNSGEKLEFTGYYNWGFIWLNAGKIKVDVNTIQYQNKSAYQLKAAAKNAKAFEIFFKLRDSLTTILDTATLKPYSLDRITNEGNYHARHVYSYQYPQGVIKTYIRKNKRKVKKFNLPMKGCVNNILSVLAYARNINYDKLKKGDKIPFQMLVDGKISKVEVRYKGVGKVKTKRGYKFNCYKITPVLPEGSMFKGGDEMVIWLSKDKNRVPVMVEAKIPVGSVKGVLENYSGLRHKENVFGKTEGSFERGK